MFGKEDLGKLFTEFLDKNENKKVIVSKAISQLNKFDDNFAFDRKCFDDGHFVSGVLVVNKEFTKILFMHHKKKGMWMHFGGHADGEFDLFNVAKRELEEEASIKEADVKFEPEILNLDIHTMIAHKNEPEHIHYEMCNLAIVSDKINFTKQIEEVNDIKWFSVEEVKNMSSENGDIADGTERHLEMFFKNYL